MSSDTWDVSKKKQTPDCSKPPLATPLLPLAGKNSNVSPAPRLCQPNPRDVGTTCASMLWPPHRVAADVLCSYFHLLVIGTGRKSTNRIVLRIAYFYSRERRWGSWVKQIRMYEIIIINIVKMKDRLRKQGLISKYVSTTTRKFSLVEALCRSNLPTSLSSRERGDGPP